MTGGGNPVRYFKDQYSSLGRMVEGITVDALAVFDLETCRQDESIEEVLERMDRLDIDHMPVDPARTRYVVRKDLRRAVGGSLISEARLKPLAPPDLVAAGTPLPRLYGHFQEREFLFVLQGIRVEGIITRGDFQRAPFRMYLFALLSLLEMGVTRMVLDAYGDDGWQDLGVKDAVSEAVHWYNKAKEHGEEPRSKFEVVSLANKLRVLKNAELVLQQFDEQMRHLILALDRSELKTLRDNLAHTKDLTTGLTGRWKQVYELADQLEQVTEVVAC